MTQDKLPIPSKDHHVEVFSNKFGTTKAVVCSCGFATTYSVNGYDPDVQGRAFFDERHAELLPKDVLRDEPSAKPIECPFCGVVPRVMLADAQLGHHQIVCGGCRDLNVETLLFLEPSSAIDAWNKRAASKLSPVPPSPKCGKFAGNLHPRLGLHYACVLDAGHDGDCQRGGTCFKHGPYIGENCAEWPNCIAPAPSEGLIKEAEETMKQLVCECCGKKIYAETSYIHEDNDMYCDDGNFLARPKSVAPVEATAYEGQSFHLSACPCYYPAGRPDHIAECPTSCHRCTCPKKVETTGSETATRIAELEEELKAVIDVRDTAVAQLEWWAKNAGDGNAR